MAGPFRGCLGKKYGLAMMRSNRWVRETRYFASMARHLEARIS